jgi:hypothetical protein
LLAVNTLALGLYGFARLDRTVAERFGPVGEAVYNLLNPYERTTVPLSTTARRFEKDVEAIGGVRDVWVMEPGVLGGFGRTEWFSARFHNRAFDDEALARFAESYGDRIGELELVNTAVTDAGLRHLKKMTMLRHLRIRKDARNVLLVGSEPPPTITDAGLVHLKGLTQLWTLDLDGLPVSDAGLDAIKNLPTLMSLGLNRTEVQGANLARLKSLPRLSTLGLAQSAMTEEGIHALAGATNLQFLSLSGVPLTKEALSLLRAIPRLNELEITGCGLLDEDVDALAKSRPRLRVVRQ